MSRHPSGLDIFEDLSATLGPFLQHLKDFSKNRELLTIFPTILDLFKEEKKKHTNEESFQDTSKCLRYSLRQGRGAVKLEASEMERDS